MVNRAQALVLGFFLLAVTSLLVILACRPATARLLEAPPVGGAVAALRRS
jgi:hypothetical protein